MARRNHQFKIFSHEPFHKYLNISTLQNLDPILYTMARRRTKKRTHVGANNARPKGTANNASMSREPKSMVVRVGAGEVGPSVTQLVKDVRSMLEPGTASRLKVHSLATISLLRS